MSTLLAQDLLACFSIDNGHATEYTQRMADKHDPLELEWFKIGLSGPARRALVSAKLYKVSDLRKVSLSELQTLHGMGKSAIARICQIMDAKKISFKK